MKENLPPVFTAYGRDRSAHNGLAASFLFEEMFQLCNFVWPFFDIHVFLRKYRAQRLKMIYLREVLSTIYMADSLYLHRQGVDD